MYMEISISDLSKSKGHSMVLHCNVVSVWMGIYSAKPYSTKSCCHMVSCRPLMVYGGFSKSQQLGAEFAFALCLKGTKNSSKPGAAPR